MDKSWQALREPVGLFALLSLSLLRCASLETIAYHLHLSVADISSLLLAEVSPISERFLCL